jgi:hypothetical protein
VLEARIVVDATKFIDGTLSPSKIASDVSLREGVTRRARAGSNVSNLYFTLEDYSLAGYWNNLFGDEDDIRGDSSAEWGLAPEDEYGDFAVTLNNVNSVDVSVPNLNISSIFDYFQQNDTTASSVYYETWFEKANAKTYNYLNADANEAGWYVNGGSAGFDCYGGVVKQSVDLSTISESDLVIGFHRTGSTIRIIQNGSLLESVSLNANDGLFYCGFYWDNTYTINFENDWTKTLRLTLFRGGDGLSFGVIDDISFDAEDVKYFYIATNAVGSDAYVEVTVSAYALDDGVSGDRNHLYKTEDDLITITLPDPPNPWQPPTTSLGSSPSYPPPGGSPSSSSPPPSGGQDVIIFTGTNDQGQDTVVICDGSGCIRGTRQPSGEFAPD